MVDFLSDPSVNHFTGVYRGDGINHENRPLQSSFTGEPILGGKAFRIHFVAHDSEGEVLHEEDTVLTADHKMYNFSTGTGATVLERAKTPSGEMADSQMLWQFTAGNLDDPKSTRMRVTLRKAGQDVLEYCHEWAAPGDVLTPRASVVLKRY